MSRQLRCPNCGGEHTLANPGITMLVCQFCKTVVYWGADEQLQTGKQSILPEADTRLYLLASGKLRKPGTQQHESFQVVGHLRYQHQRGSWDEWYLQLDDGGVVWLSEDERELSLEIAASPDGAPPAANSLEVGAKLGLEGQSFTVREVGRATCVGGEGQLPFTILPGESYAYADVASADGKRFGTLEYDEQTRPSCFVGHVLDHQALQIDDEKPPSTAGATEGRHIKCSNCAAALEVPAGRDVETQVCDYCGAQLDLSSDEQQVLGVNPPDFDPQFTFEIGNAATFYGKRYEVCGRLLYIEDRRYETREYLLFNPDAGYLWLAEENNHFVLNRPTQQAPSRDAFHLSTAQAVKVGPTTFRFFEQGSTRLHYVDGALPWVAKVGDVFRYADLIAPPQIFSVESDGTEVEYFHGRYQPTEEVWSAFKKEAPVRRPRGVHAAQPFVRGTVAKLLMSIGFLFALVNLGFMVWSLGQKGDLVFQGQFPATQYLKETVSSPFQLPGCNIISMHMTAPLDNSWISADVAFLNDKRQVVAEMSNDIEYYHGYEGGESWTEGSRTNTEYFKAPGPGSYRLIVKASGGRGNTTTPGQEALQVRIYAGAVITRFFLAAFILTIVFPLYEFMRKRLFEQRRWSPVMQSDDDDDDDDDWD